MGRTKLLKNPALHAFQHPVRHKVSMIAHIHYNPD
jgi:hypothetical protein